MKYLIIYFLLLLSLAVNAQKNWWEGFPKRPENYVTDQQNFLSQHEKTMLNEKLRAFEDSTTTQLLVYLTKSLAGKNLEVYSKEIFNTWGIGQKDKNNGILIAIFMDDHQYRIQIGYGLESVLPSELTLQIQDEDMRHHFKDGNFYEGIDAGVDKLIYYSRHEYQPPSPFKTFLIPLAIAATAGILLFIFNLFSLKKWNNQPKRKRNYLLLSILFLVAPVLLIAALSSFKTLDFETIFMPALGGAFAQLILSITVNDKNGIKYDHESDDAYERRMRERASSDSSSSSDDSFSGGGGGSSDSGGSSSRW